MSDHSSSASETTILPPLTITTITRDDLTSTPTLAELQTILLGPMTRLGAHDHDHDHEREKWNHHERELTVQPEHEIEQTTIPSPALPALTKEAI
ncbi:hypothetical protein DL98DRAFT_588287 [Cadophora sp. DSE1049]|nr:hypothetical protein DL98DRAFT_588287 [Cadophora sp. DSE1049]